MNTATINVSISGSGPLATLLEKHINARPDLNLVNEDASQCVLHLPTVADVESGEAAKRITELLGRGQNVVSTAPVQSINHTDLLGACRNGGASFHGTGGYQCSLISRFNRAFAAITRGISRVELAEDIAIESIPGFEFNADQELEPQAASLQPYYENGLHTLHDAVFNANSPSMNNSTGDEILSITTLKESEDHAPRLAGAPNSHHIKVQRTMGNVAYDSVWRLDANKPALQYTLSTQSSDATGHVMLTFEQEGETHPVLHLTCKSLLDAVRAVTESKPGILHHNLDINYVKPDDRLA